MVNKGTCTLQQLVRNLYPGPPEHNLLPYKGFLWFTIQYASDIGSLHQIYMGNTQEFVENNFDVSVIVTTPSILAYILSN